MKKAKNYVFAILLGIFTGCLTLIGQKYLPNNLNFLSNSGAVWLVPAFLVSYLSKTSKNCSIALCVIFLFFCVNSYYVFETIINNHGFTFSKWQVVWNLIAVIAGSIFGLGAYFANTENGIVKYFGMNLLPAVFFSEGLQQIINIGEYIHMIPASIMITCIGLIMYFAINRKDCFKKYNMLSFAILSIIGLVGYLLLNII